LQTYCDSIFGQGGAVEFRADAVMAIGRDGTAHVLTAMGMKNATK
jgi:hypothetical protein